MRISPFLVCGVLRTATCTADRGQAGGRRRPPGASQRRRRAGSRGTARRPRRSAQRSGRGATRWRGAAPRARPCRDRSRGRRRGARPGGRGRATRPPASGRNAGPRPSSRTRPTSWRSAAARRRSARSRGWSCAVSRASVATPTVCSSSPPAYPWCPSAPAAGRSRMPSRTSGSARIPPTSAARPGWAISAARNSRNPSSSSASRRSAGASSAGSASEGSTARTWSWSRPSKRSTRASTRTASPSSKRRSRRSTSSQMRPSILPLGSTSSSRMYGFPFRVVRRRLRATA